MAYANLERLQAILQCPTTGHAIAWEGGRGYVSGSVCVERRGRSFVFGASELSDDYDTPLYASSNPYQQPSLELIREFPEGCILDAGAGKPRFSFDNVVEMEISLYSTTDVVVPEGRFPFSDASFDAVISEAVLEHVADPFTYVREIHRVLRPGGKVVLDAAFMQPEHGAPSHYFNTTEHAVRLLFRAFQIDELTVGPHQHPWIALHWIMTEYLSGMDEADRAAVERKSVRELLDTLKSLQGKRDVIKRGDDPWRIAQGLRTFNRDLEEELGPLLRIRSLTNRSLAAGFEILAVKPESAPSATER